MKGELDHSKARRRVGKLPVYVTRGYEVMHLGEQELKFIGALDGPVVEITGPKSCMLMSIDAAKDLITVLQQVVETPVAAPGTHDAELIALGCEPISGRS